MPFQEPGNVSSATAAINGSDRSKAHEMTCQPPRRRESVARPLGIAKAAEHDGGHHQNIAKERTSTALEKGEARDSRPSKAREQPEHRLRSLAAAQHAEDRRCERQEADEDDGVCGCNVLKRQCRQQRETDDHAKCDDGERGKVASRGPCLPQQGKERRTEERRDHRAGRGQEQRREVADGGACCWQRAAKDHYAYKAAAPPFRCPVHVPCFQRTICEHRALA